jgi:hypothetical protein
MPKLLAFILPAVALLAFAGPANGGEVRPAHACPGIVTSLFEQRFPDQVQRYAFDDTMVEPFVELWASARRPALPLPTERVTVYSLPGRPFLVGYQHGDCVIAFLAIGRDQLLQLLRPRLGWPV